MVLPQFQSNDAQFTMMQNTWAKTIQPLLNSPIATPIVLSGVTLTAGTNTINHMLDDNLRGWIIIRKRGSADIWDNQDNNSIPNKTLLLISSSGVSVDLIVF